MKNYHFKRNLKRKIAKAQRNLEIYMLYESLQNVRDVADWMGINKDTVVSVLASNSYIHTSDGKQFVLKLEAEPKDI